MFTVSVETDFRASHQLRFPDGCKEPLHRHNWRVTAEVSRESLDDMGFVIDFHRLKAIVAEVVAQFDNRALEQVDYFQRNNSSAENVAKYVYDQIEVRLPRGIEVQSISVMEEPGCLAKFTRRRVRNGGAQKSEDGI